MIPRSWSFPYLIAICIFHVFDHIGSALRRTMPLSIEYQFAESILPNPSLPIMVKKRYFDSFEVRQ